MGNELPCTLHHADKSFSGKALLESSEIIFRGEARLKIGFSAITAIQARDGELRVRTKDGLAVFELGPEAAKWQEKITNPKSLLDKLGVKSGQSVSLIGDFSADFVARLKKQGAMLNKSKLAKDALWIFLAANEKHDLQCLTSVRKVIRGATALWIVYPKGQKSITEADVRSSGLKAGLVDIKVASFSPTHTALKFVLPKSKR
ncbi:MAG: hypothetical protein WBQ89_02475 [Candidatus Acidiferrum sp.]